MPVAVTYSWKQEKGRMSTMSGQKGYSTRKEHRNDPWNVDRTVLDYSRSDRTRENKGAHGDSPWKQKGVRMYPHANVKDIRLGTGIKKI